MSFRFNFEGSENDDSVNECNPSVKSDHHSSDHTNEYKSKLSSCKYISAPDLKLKVETDKVNKIKFGGQEIKYITQECLSNDSATIPLLDRLNSDLLPGEYEGGLKIWECSIDLSHFLAEGNYIHPNNSVLELGCGVGLPGLLSYLCGAFVTFQDYNSEVLELITAPNVILNTTGGHKENVSEHCQFLCGDWGAIQEKFFSDAQEKKLFDVILTSETIYSNSSQNKLLTLMKSALKPGGVIYLASKVHYFGVGGGIADFEDLLKKDNTFDFSTVFKTTEGVERRILKLTFKDGYRTV